MADKQEFTLPSGIGISAHKAYLSSSTNSSSVDTGALITPGGAGFGQSVSLGGFLHLFNGNNFTALRSAAVSNAIYTLPSNYPSTGSSVLQSDSSGLMSWVPMVASSGTAGSGFATTSSYSYQSGYATTSGLATTANYAYQSGYAITSGFATTAANINVVSGSSNSAHSLVFTQTATGSGVALSTKTTLSYNPSTDILSTSGLAITATTLSTSTSTGALTVAGGVGIAGTSYFGNDVTIGNSQTGKLNFSQGILGSAGTTTNPSLMFVGQDNNPITLSVLSDNTLSFEGSSGQLFSINNNLSSGTIFSVNDISGIPIIRANANGTLSMGEFTGSVGVGLTNPSYKLHIAGDTNLSSGYVFRINGNSVLSASSLGTGVTNSSLTAVGTITTGVWSATAITAFYGGTGYNSYTKGDILVGAGSTFIKLNVGTDNFVLTASSSSATGLTWSPTAATGITTLNSLTATQQFFSVGTSGNAFNISSSGSTHTFNIPIAGSGSTGLISTQAQTIAGQKTFTSAIIGDLTGTATTAIYAYQSGYAITSGLASTASLALTISSTTTSANADYSIPFFSGSALSTNNNLYYNPSTGRFSAVIYTGSWAGNAITSFYGGTGFSTYVTGDLLVGAGSTLTKLSVGTNNFVLVADNSVAGGIKWANVSGFAITNINGLTASQQDLVFGYSGNIPAFSSSGNTHTLNIPLAGTGSTGLVSTQAQSFAGIKTFTNAVSITDNTGSGSYTAGALVVSGGVGIGGTLNVQGDLNVQGTFTTINSTTITVADKNIELGFVATPTDITAQGGGITLRGATDKSINWYSGVGWSSSESWNLAAANTYKINGTSVLSATSLGTGVTNSSLTALGTITTGTWAGSTITAFYGGTGFNSYTKGDILVGAGNTFIKLNVGADNFVLTANSSSSTGLTWSPTAATGITSLNALTATQQLFATGSSGSGFNITSLGSTHTFNIPIAGTGATGLVSTLAQSFAGVKTFTNDVIISSSTASTSMRNGALQVYGGVGISGQLSFNQASMGFTGILTNPSIAFIGTTGSPITLSVLPDNSLSFEGSSGQLFSIDNNLTTGEIFAVSDISGLPIISAYANQNVTIGEFGGNLGIGLSNPFYKLHVTGSVGFTSNIASTSTSSGALIVTGGVGIGGSLNVNSASSLSGVRIDSGVVYGNLTGTATTANYSIQSGYAITSGTANTATYAVQAGYAVTSGSSSTATTASYANQSGYGLTSGFATTSNYAYQSGYGVTSGFATTANYSYQSGYGITSGFATTATYGLQAGYAITSGNSNTSGYATTAGLATTASYAHQSGYAITSGTASTAIYSLQSGYGLTSGFASTANYSYQSGYGITSGFATTASYAYQSGYATTSGTSGLATTATYAHQSGYAVTSGSSNTSGYATTSGLATTATYSYQSGYGITSGFASTANYAHQSGYAITSGFATTGSYSYQSGYAITSGIANSSYSSFVNTASANSSHPILFSPITGSSSGAGLSLNTILNYNPSSNILYTSGLAITATTASSSTSNGALTVAGGVGISGRLSFNLASFGTTGISSNPTIAMIGSTGDPIYLSVLEDNTISFEGSQGQLFSITPNLSTGYIYSVNDITGIPLLRANANANVTSNEYAGNFGIGLSNPGYKLHVIGSVGFTSNISSTSTSTGTLVVAGGVGIGGSLNVNSPSNISSVILNSGNIYGNLIGTATTAGFATTSNYSNQSGYATTAGLATTATYALQSGYAITSGSSATATTATYALQSGYAITANSSGFATSATYSYQSGYGITSGFATTANYAISSGLASTATYSHQSGYATTSGSSNTSGIATTAYNISVNTGSNNIYNPVLFTPQGTGSGVAVSSLGAFGFNPTANKLSVSGLAVTAVTASTSTSTGALTVAGGLGVVGDVFVASTPNSKLSVMQSSGDEGGEIFLNKPVTNTTITSGVTIDIYQNKLRFFEAGGSARGFYLDITTGGNGANTDIMGSSSSGTVNSGTATYAAYYPSSSNVVSENANLQFTGTGISIGGNIASTSTTSGSLKVFGGVGIGGSLYVGGMIRLGSDTFAKTYSLGDILLDNGATDTPAIRYYWANNKNFGTDVISSGAGSTRYRIVKDINESGGAELFSIDTTGAIQIYNGANFSGFRFTGSGSTIYTLPSTAPATGTSFLQSDSSGVLSWVTPTVAYANQSGYATTSGSSNTSGYATTSGLATTATYSYQSGYAITSGNSNTSGYATTSGLATTATYAYQSGYGLTSGFATTATYSYQSGYAITSGNSNTSGYATTSGLATTATYSYQAGYAITSSSSGTANTSTYSHQSGYAITSGSSNTSGYATTSGLATTATYSYQSGYGLTAGFATTANYALQSGYAITSGLATTATYSYQSGYGLTAGLATSSYSSFINSASANTSHSLIFAPITSSSSGSGLSLNSTLNFNPSTNILYTSGLAVTASTNSTSSSSGALVVTGGLGVGSTSYFNTDVNIGNSTRGRLYFSQATLGSAGTTVIPSMAFIGATNSPITLSVLPDNSLSFDGSSGQLFSINNNLSTGWIFSVNDISGLPIFRANADLTVAMGEYGGNTGIGLSNPSYKLHVAGDTNLSTGYVYRINGISVLSSTSLGTGVTNSSLTALGVITTGTWSGSTITSFYGGTGYQTYSTGDLLVGAGSTLSKLSVGANNFVLVADNTVVGGVKWANASGLAITNINGLTASKQDLAIGYSGNVPAFSSSGNTHTLNIPLAGSGSTGLVSTQAQTFAGQKTFTSGIVGDLTGTATTSGFASTAFYAHQSGYGLTSGFAVTSSYAYQAGYAITSGASATATTATYAHQSGYATTAGYSNSSGYATTAGLATTATYAYQSGYAITSGNSNTSGYAITSGLATTSTYAYQSGYGLTSGFATTANYAYQSGYAITSGNSNTSGYAITSGLATTATYSYQSGYAITSGFATTASYSYQSGYAITSGLATTANYSYQSGYGLTSGFATTSSYSYQSGYAITSGLATSSTSVFINNATANSSHPLVFTPTLGSSSGAALSTNSTVSYNPSANYLYTSGLAVTASTASTSTSTGALIVNGGVGISGQLSYNTALIGTTGIASQPTMTFIGANGDPVRLRVLDDSTLAFSGSQGQLFSINPVLNTGYIFSVNDISGVPLLRANADATVSMGEFAGNIGIGLSNPAYKLHVTGSVGFTSSASSTSPTTGALVVTGGVGIGGTLFSSSSYANSLSGVVLNNGVVTSGSWAGSLITGLYGGTGFNSYTKGDLLVGSGTTLIKHAVGTQNQILIADVYSGSGLSWATFANPTYGSFYSTSSQQVVGAGATTLVNFNSTYESNRVSIIGGTGTSSRIQIQDAGPFSITFSAQINLATGTQPKVGDFWFRVNGVDVPQSNTQMTISGKDFQTVITVNFVYTFANNDYFEIAFSSSDTEYRIEALTGLTNPTRPDVPSIICSVLPVTHIVGASGAGISGILSINGSTSSQQYFVEGHSGTNFNIQTGGGTHTFNIPYASTGATGLVTTLDQSFAGVKTFTNDTIISSSTASTSFSTGALLVTGGVGIGGALNVQGDLNVQGTFTTINSTTITVADKNIELGVVTSPTDITAQGGGITLRGATDKSINWYSGVGWSSSESWNLANGNSYKISGVTVLSASSLGTGVTNSSLTALGTITTGVWAGTSITALYGGTGLVPSFTVGDILYANTSTTWGRLTASSNSGYVLTSAGAGTTPVYVAPSTLSVGSATTATYSHQSGYAITSGSSGFATTASYAYQSGYGLTSGLATTANYAHQSGYAITSGNSNTSNFATNANYAYQSGYGLTSGLATTANYAYQSGYAITSGNSNTSGYAITSGLATTSNYSYQSGYGLTSGLATTANYAYQSGYGLTSGFSTTASYSYQSGYAITSGSSALATTANYAHQSGYAITSGNSNTSGYAVTSGFATTASNLNVSNASTGIFYPILSNTASSASGVGASVNSFFSFNAANGAFGATSVNIIAGQSYSVGGNSVLSASSLGTGVTNSSLTALGTITTGTWSGSTITSFYGGSGYQTYATGDLLIGAGTTLIKLAVGSNNFVLTADNTVAGGVKWTATAATGLTTLNGLNAGMQYFATGTSGSGFNISSSGSTHTFNIPIAGTGATGLVSTLAQSFAGVKTFTNDVIISSSTASTFIGNGALQVYGGVGISGRLSFNQAAMGFTGILTNPSIAFIGTTGSPITLSVLSDNSLSFEGSSGQLFSIDNNLTTGEIFAVSDISGLPIISAYANQNVSIGEFGGNLGIGLSNPFYKLHVIGSVGFTSNIASTSTSTGTLVVTGGVGIGGSLNVNSASSISGVRIDTGIVYGNLTGTATTAGFASTANYSNQSGYGITSGFATTSSYSYTSGYGITAGLASTATYSHQSGYAITSGSSGFATTATYAYQSGYGLTSGLATTATYSHQSGYAITSGSSSTSGYATTSGFATTASYAYQSGYGLTSGLATTATYAHQSGYAITSGSSNTSGYAITSGFADTSTYSYQSGYGLTSGFASTATYSYTSGYGITSGLATTATYAHQSGFAQTATSASTATTATNSTYSILTADTTNATRRLVFTANGTGSTSLYNTSTVFTNPSTSSVGASVFTGFGSVNIRPGVDSTSGVSIGNSSGSSYVYFDTINGRIGINQPTPLYDLHIVGEISATNKSFVIDHPTKPDMMLRHGSLEGPENGVYVRGKLVNNNIIELPDYWLGLVDEDSITVNLTPMGRYSQLFVEKIEDNTIYISDSSMNPINCYFTVFGERKDIPKLDVEY